MKTQRRPHTHTHTETLTQRNLELTTISVDPFQSICRYKQENHSNKWWRLRLRLDREGGDTDGGPSRLQGRENFSLSEILQKKAVTRDNLEPRG